MRNDRLHLPSGLWREAPLTGQKDPFCPLGCVWLCMTLWLQPEHGGTSGTIKTYSAQQLGVDLRRNMALPRDVFKKEEQSKGMKRQWAGHLYESFLKY